MNLSFIPVSLSFELYEQPKRGSMLCISTENCFSFSMLKQSLAAETRNSSENESILRWFCVNHVNAINLSGRNLYNSFHFVHSLFIPPLDISPNTVLQLNSWHSSWNQIWCNNQIGNSFWTHTKELWCEHWNSQAMFAWLLLDAYVLVTLKRVKRTLTQCAQQTLLRELNQLTFILVLCDTNKTIAQLIANTPLETIQPYRNLLSIFSFTFVLLINWTAATETSF